LYNVSSNGRKTNKLQCRDEFQACNLSLKRGLSASSGEEDILPNQRIRLRDGEIRTICRSIIPTQAQVNATTKIGHSDGAAEFALGRR